MSLNHVSARSPLSKVPSNKGGSTSTPSSEPSTPSSGSPGRQRSGYKLSTLALQMTPIKLARKKIAGEHPDFFPKGSTPDSTPEEEFDEEAFDFNADFREASSTKKNKHGERGRDQKPKALGTMHQSTASANQYNVPKDSSSDRGAAAKGTKA
ncbi:hypothetical protein NEOLEDRAFT_1245741 [Neolentinus lepideus HHB14362 ss-1]|uniref:Uncharacterized protein n=1 Tax=Neolentinus lepideus HHB14362 ss-1 TaxID=1314782 RepID=A0A165NFD5_9AGAM|nr:hypothetical protein NEOLEDRAFT_1245741 [Neolentinus lepideus HHB14362 ss-1]